MSDQQNDSSLSETIKQSVMIGSVFLALENKLFTHSELLQWLLVNSNEDFDENFQIAYKAVCSGIDPNLQYLEDDDHFIKKKPQYSAVSHLLGLNPLLSYRRHTDEKDYLPFFLVIQNSIDKLNFEEYSICRIIAGVGDHDKEYVFSKLSTSHRSRNFPHLNVSPDEINKGLVDADWVQKFRYTPQLASLVLKRITKLKEKAPLYYSSVGYKVYRNVIIKLYNEKLFTELTKEQLHVISDYFPCIIDPKILSYNNLCYKISLLGNDLAGYILGFPIHTMIPNDDQISLAIDYLMNHTPKEYCTYISTYVSKSYSIETPFSSSSPTYANNQDVIMENIDDYVPFDIVSYQTGNYIYRFTRPEFKQLIKSKKNHWTNEWLPLAVLSVIKQREITSREIGLPQSLPLYEIFDHLDKDTLFFPDKTQSHSNKNKNSAPIILVQLAPTFFPPSDEYNSV